MVIKDNDTPPREQRRQQAIIKVYCLPVEKTALQAKAAATGLSSSTYLRRVGMGYKTTTILDQQQVHALAKVNGDLGRLGGLLKLWLARDPRTAPLSATTVRELLVKIDDLQNELRIVMTKVVKR